MEEEEKHSPSWLAPCCLGGRGQRRVGGGAVVARRGVLLLLQLPLAGEPYTPTCDQPSGARQRLEWTRS